MLSFRVPEERVSSLELWNFTSQTAGYKKLTLLALIIYILLVMALAHPAWFVKGNNYLIVLDRSSSMMTMSANDNISVFDKGKNTVYKLLQRFSAFDRVEVLLFPQKKYIRGTREEIAKQLTQSKCTHIPTNVNLAYIDFSVFDDVFIISDGTHALENWPGKKIFVGNTTTDNIGIIRFRSQQIAVGKWRIFFAVKNFSSRNQKTLVSALSQDTVVWQEKMLFTAQQTIAQSFIIDSPQIKTLRLSVEANDNFFLDNTVCAAKTDVVVVKMSKTHHALAKLFAKIPGVSPVENEQTSHLTCEYYTEKRRVFFNEKPPRSAAKAVVISPQIFFVAHPLWDWILPGIEIERATPLQHFHGKALLQTENGPIAVYNDEYLYIGFELHESNWPRLPSFPIFWINYFDYFFPQRDNFHYALTNELQSTIEHQQQTFYNHISERESHNIGSSSRDAFEIKSSSSIEHAMTMRQILLGMCVLLLLYLWWKE